MSWRQIGWLWALVAAIGLLGLGCGPVDEDDNDAPPLMDVDVLLAGAPDKADLVDEKTDVVPPKQFDLLAYQSPVRNQRSRGVCSIFATVALMEHLYIKEGTYTQPDFSEQYLQWSVKVEVGDFTYTEGSSASSNLEAINRFGIVNESDWPYDATPWTSANDPECSGEDNLPVKCYTNGDPPQAARDAKKWKLPTSRWVSSNANSIKAFMLNKNQGVIVGGTFYYQAWNHGASSLPLNSEYKRQGWVLAPNDKDREESLKHRAGHAFLLVGWDDELSAQKMDGEGKPMVDADGQPMMETGFFLFKNSWGTGSWGGANPKGVGYGWIAYNYVKELSAVGADLPKVDPVIVPEDCTNGVDDDRDGKTDCDDTDCTADGACQAERLLYENSNSAAIPDNSAAGLTSTIEVPLAATISALDLTVDINHTYRGDLEIRLVHPSGADTQILAPTSDSGDDVKQTFAVGAFNGRSTQGNWTLKVIDHAAMDTGTLNRWSLRFVTGGASTTLTIGACNLQAPATIEGAPGGSTAVSGRVYVAGVTDATSGNDPHPSLIGQLGYGPVGSAPGASWTWINSAPRAGWSDGADPGRDEYSAALTAPAEGDYHYAYRFSGDAGLSWTVCDLDGSANGYSADRAGLMIIENQPTVTPELLFSEYVEGSASNKAIEITNVGAASTPLSGCAILLYINGSPTPSRTAVLSGSLTAGGTFVLCHPNAVQAVLGACHQTDGAVGNFNGDDTLVLACNGQVLDVFGRTGEDPGTAWGSGDTSTVNHTLRRKCGISRGDTNGTDSFDPVSEWDGYAIDTFDGLGRHCN